MLIVVAVTPKTILVTVSVELDEAEEDILTGAISAARRCRLHDILSNDETVDGLLTLRQPFYSESQPSYRTIFLWVESGRISAVTIRDGSAGMKRESQNSSHTLTRFGEAA